MSRTKRYAQALVSGYSLLGANVLFTLASVPLALSYLSNEQFGLWAVVTQIGGFIGLLDFGMSGAVSRILIDHKDNKEDGEYSSVVMTAGWVGVTQGGLALMAGTLMATAAAPLMKIPPELTRAFFWLLVGQSGLLALGLSTRVFNHILIAHQRYDVSNYTQAIMFGLNYSALWFAFSHGQGVFSALWAQMTAQTFQIACLALWCYRLKLFPAAGQWKRASWKRFKEMFDFGKDVFIVAAGSQMINSSQIVIVSNVLGLEMATVWSVCTRTFLVVCQVVWRILDYSAAPLSEMHVRGEQTKFLRAFRSITVLTASFALVAGTLFAALNQSFLAIWTSGRISWSPLNDVLLGIWCVLLSVQRCHCGLLGVLKRLQGVRFVYLFEGGFFVLTAWLVARFFGTAGIIGCSLIATLLFSFLYGVRQTIARFNLSPAGFLIGWLWPAARVALGLAPCAAALWLMTRSLAPLPRLILLAGMLVPLGGWLMLNFGLDPELQGRLAKTVPPRFRRWLKMCMPSWKLSEPDTRGAAQTS